MPEDETRNYYDLKVQLSITNFVILHWHPIRLNSNNDPQKKPQSLIGQTKVSLDVNCEKRKNSFVEQCM